MELRIKRGWIIIRSIQPDDHHPLPLPILRDVDPPGALISRPGPHSVLSYFKSKQFCIHFDLVGLCLTDDLHPYFFLRRFVRSHVDSMTFDKAKERLGFLARIGETLLRTVAGITCRRSTIFYRSEIRDCVQGHFNHLYRSFQNSSEIIFPIRGVLKAFGELPGNKPLPDLLLGFRLAVWRLRQIIYSAVIKFEIRFFAFLQNSLVCHRFIPNIPIIPSTIYTFCKRGAC